MLTEICPRLVKLGYEVTVYVRSPYTDGKKGSWEYEGVKIICLPCIKNKYLETPSHTLLALIHSLQNKYDVYFFHAVVTGMFVPLARLFGKKVLLQTHGLDWKREKWNRIAKFVIKFSTQLGIRFSHQIASVSLEEVEYFQNHFKKPVIHLPNGIPIIEPTNITSEIDKFNLQTGKYILFLSRLVPEKGCHFLINAWNSISKELRSGYKLVIAGDTQYKDEYYSSLRTHGSDNIIFTGFAVGELKRQILSHAALFVQPSTMEGMPISVLEAMGYGLPVIGSDIREISEIVLDKLLLFKSGNADSLKEVLEKTLVNIQKHKLFAQEKREDILAKYSWDASAKILDGLIRELVNG